MTASPLRMVYMAEERGENDGEPLAQMMVSVPKRFFKRAVKRNRIKRQVREAYRLNKHIIVDCLATTKDRKLSLCFIWTADRLLPTSEVMGRMSNLLTRLSEKMSKTEEENIAK